jgi:NADH-quinone oxidoreductase subunit E
MWMVSPPADWFGKEDDRLAFGKSAAPLMMMNPFIVWSAMTVASAAMMMAAGQAVSEAVTGKAMPEPAQRPASKGTAATKAVSAKAPKAAAPKTKPKTAPTEALARPIVSKTIEKAVKAPLAAPIPATEKPAAKPAVKSPSRPSGLEAPRAGRANDLKRISGIGPKLEMVLNDLGIYHFDQIAGWSRAEIDWIDEYLQFKGRVDRDKWIGQAKKLAGN